VVANHREVLGHVDEETGAVVTDSAEPPVHRLRGAADPALEQVADPLVAEADPQHRNLAVAEDVAADAKSCQRSGRPGPGESTNASNSDRVRTRQETASLLTTTGSSPEAAASRWKTL
jgi:hypothetical protein